MSLMSVLINGREAKVVVERLRQLMNHYVLAHLPIPISKLDEKCVNLDWDDFQQLQRGLADRTFTYRDLGLDEKTFRHIELAMVKYRASFCFHSAIRQERQFQQLEREDERLIISLAMLWSAVVESLDQPVDSPRWFLADRDENGFYSNAKKARSRYRFRQAQLLLEKMRQPEWHWHKQQLEDFMGHWGITWQQLGVSRRERLRWRLREFWRRLFG